MNDVADPMTAPTIPRAADWRAPVPPKKRRGRWLRIMALVLALAALDLHHTVTGDPGLEFGNFNVFRGPAGDKTGIEDLRNTLGIESKVDFVSEGIFVAYVALYNGGARDVRVEAIPQARYHYWGLSGAALSTDDTTAFMGEDYVPLRPFTLGKGETAYLRLDFRMADCGPFPMEDGWSSTVDSVRVRYHVLGFTRTADVPFDETALSMLAGGPCERPIDQETGGMGTLPPVSPPPRDRRRSEVVGRRNPALGRSGAAEVAPVRFHSPHRSRGPCGVPHGTNDMEAGEKWHRLSRRRLAPAPPPSPPRPTARGSNSSSPPQAE